MITKRNFYVILMLFFVVFFMLMLVDLSTNLFMQDDTNPAADKPITIAQTQVFTRENLRLEADEEPAEESQQVGQGSQQAGQAPAVDSKQVAIIVREETSAETSVLVEWCVYGKYRYSVHTTLPDAHTIAGCRAVLFGTDAVGPEDVPLLQAYARTGVPLLFAKLPDFQALSASPELADFFGIDQCVQAEYSLEGIYLFGEFFLGEDRIYEPGDIYGDEDDDVYFEKPHYTLRPGFLVYAQGLPTDPTVDYMDRPALLWRTRTGHSNVYVNNTELFGGKNLLGLLTACMSQEAPYYLYPIVNAQSIALLDFPMLSNEAQEEMMRTYTRSAEALSRDVLWPGVAKILRNYASSYNFFLSPELDYADGIEPSSEYISFYFQEIQRMMGSLGLSLNQVSQVPLSQQLDKAQSFLGDAMPNYVFTAAYLPTEQLSQWETLENRAPLEKATILMTDEAPDQPLVGFVDEQTVAVSFTTDGFVHESMDDLHLLCIETALGMNHQKVEMSKAFYMENNLDWNQLNLLWARGDTFRKPFAVFDDLSVYDTDDRARTFLAVDYDTAYQDGTITLTLREPWQGSSFVLRLIGQEVVKVEGATLQPISATAWLLRPAQATVTIQVRYQHRVEQIPTDRLEVRKQ